VFDAGVVVVQCAMLLALRISGWSGGGDLKSEALWDSASEFRDGDMREERQVSIRSGERSVRSVPKGRRER
jgi:hypothetical protein